MHSAMSLSCTTVLLRTNTDSPVHTVRVPGIIFPMRDVSHGNEAFAVLIMCEVVQKVATSPVTNTYIYTHI